MDDLDRLGKWFFGKRILVTGHTGFKGGWLVQALKLLGAEVFGYSLPPESRESLYFASKVQGLLSGEVYGDIRDYASFFEFCERIEPEIVFHLAAQPLVLASISNPRHTFEVNFMGSLNVVEVLRKTKSVRVLLCVTTDKVYGAHGGKSVSEEDQFFASDPYSTSKACADLMVQSYLKTFKNSEMFKTAIVRAGNVIGGGDWAQDRLVPDFFRAVASNSVLNVRNPSHVRPWQHVITPTLGYLCLAWSLGRGQLSESEAWNLGPQDFECGSVEKVIELLSKNVTFSPVVKYQDAIGNQENPCLILDSAKSRELLGFHLDFSIEEIIAMTAEWYETYSNGGPVRELTIEQLRLGFSKAGLGEV